MNTVKENLIAAKALIADPESWGKGAYEVGGCYCAYGAIMAARGDDPRDPFAGDHVTDEDWALVNALPDGETRELTSVVHFNDAPETTHADIMALFDRAIAACPDP